MPIVGPTKKLVFKGGFINNIPRIPVCFIRKDKQAYFTRGIILDSGSNALVINKELFDFFSENNDYNIREVKIPADTAGGKETVYEIDDVSFVVGVKYDIVTYRKEKVYYSPKAINISLGTHPIFRDFDVTIKLKDQEIILDPR